jgi:predicted ATPase
MRKSEIKRVTLSGYKSIASLTDFCPGPITVFIGQNGAGKSNFIGFFKLLSNMLSGTGNLANFVSLCGGASALLFDGPETTPQLTAHICLQTATGLNEYKFCLTHASADTFIYTEEKFRYSAADRPTQPDWVDLGSGHRESALINAESVGKTQGTIRKLLQQLVTYQFHNTTFHAPIRNQKSDIDNHWFLEEDGRNLASVLLELKENQTAVYQKIIGILQQILPFFDDFVLINEYGKVYLRWQEKNSRQIFTASQASDGMLRAMALVTLLCLPPVRLPAVMFLDEPELGLHPSAIKIVCELIHGISDYCQVFVATQSADMLNEFMPEEIVVVTRNGRQSEFRQLDPQELEEWLADYSLSDLWHRNIIGGKP